MKKILSLVAFLSLLMSCQTSSFAYEDFKDHQISFTQMFVEEKNHYVYFYDETCFHCKKIESEVLSFFLENTVLFYLVKDVPLNHFHSTYLSSLGAKKSEDVYIPGFPTMIFIESKEVKEYYVGTNEIKNWMNSFNNHR